MNSPKLDTETLSAARGRLEAWFATVRGDGGYGGPVVGLRGQAMGYCGAGHDWRWEGLLDGWGERHRRTGEPEWLDRIEQALRDLAAAQLLNGAFRNSYFDLNPLEGGMPHEPAVMAAALRGIERLRAANRPLPDGAAAMLERFVEERLIRELWNKLLHTFNNWLQSDFESYSPPAVAAAIETLVAYGDLTGQTGRLEPYVQGAGESLLKAQFKTGPLAGSLPVSSRDRATASPYLAARCLPALVLLHRRTGDARFGDAAAQLTEAALRCGVSGGGFSAVVHADRPPSTYPLLAGAAAGVLIALHRAGVSRPEVTAAQVPWVLARQTGSGAFETGVGFDRRPRQCRACDWRDALPVCGWNDKVYHLLALLDEQPDNAAPASTQPVCRHVTVLGRPATFAEEATSMQIKGRDGTLWFSWRKGSVWPEACLL